MKFGLYFRWWKNGVLHELELLRFSEESLSTVITYSGSDVANGMVLGPFDVTKTPSLEIVIRKLEEK